MIQTYPNHTVIHLSKVVSYYGIGVAAYDGITQTLSDSGIISQINVDSGIISQTLEES